MEKPNVSIIVPNYNHAAFLQKRLDSIVNQSYKNFEVILLDDSSTDGSQEILKEYAKLSCVSHLVLNTTNSGSTFKQWNKGIELSQGNHIWIAESDDVADYRLLERLVNMNELSKNDMSFVYCQSLNIDDKENILSNRLDDTREFEPNIWQQDFDLDGQVFIEKYLKIRNLVPNASAVLINSAKLKQVRNYSYMEMKKCGDWLFWILLAQLGRVGFVSEPLNYFREHSGVTRNHKDVEHLYIRCLEEKQVRLKLLSQYNIEQYQEIDLLYTRWFSRLEFKHVFTRKFYDIRMPNTDFFTYVRTFLVYMKFLPRIKNKILKLMFGG